jgi:hypothetical protein
MLKVLLVEVVVTESEDVDLCNMLMVDACEKRTFRRTRLESDDGEESSNTGTTDALSISAPGPPPQKPSAVLLLKHVQEPNMFPRASTAEHAPIKRIDSIIFTQLYGDMNFRDRILYLLSIGPREEDRRCISLVV